MPIFPSPSYHGYDVTKFDQVNTDYGTLDDFSHLIEATHARGVKVILDLPLNHTSSQHPWFQKAIQGPHSRERQWYNFKRKGSGTEAGWFPASPAPDEQYQYQAIFSSGMPDLNYDNPEVRQAAKDIARVWLERGVDGFRLDAAKHIYGDSISSVTDNDIQKTNQWWQEFSKYVYAVKSDAILVGEVLGDYNLGVRFAPGLEGLVNEQFMWDARSATAGDRPGFLYDYQRFLREARAKRTSDPSNAGMPNRPFQFFQYLASHDADKRLESDFEDRKRLGMLRTVEQGYSLAMYLLLTVSPYAIVYQGDEIMQKGYKWYSDPFDRPLREPFPWYKSGEGPCQTKWFRPIYDKPNDGVSKEEQEQSGGMLPLVRSLTHFRAKHSVFSNAELNQVLSDSGDWIVFEKTGDSKRYLVLINTTNHELKYKFHGAWYPEYRNAQVLFRGDGIARKWADTTSGAIRITGTATVPPFGLVILLRP